MSICYNQIMTYKITCLDCKSNQVVDIDERRQINWGNADRIISGRYRLDNQWGWQCICGNNDIMTGQEKRVIKNPQAPDPKDIRSVLKNLIPDKPKFAMEPSR